jgi:hypothetical protein
VPGEEDLVGLVWSFFFFLLLPTKKKKRGDEENGRREPSYFQLCTSKRPGLYFLRSAPCSPYEQAAITAEKHMHLGCGPAYIKPTRGAPNSYTALHCGLAKPYIFPTFQG